LFPKGLENKLYFQYNKKVPKKVSAALNPERHLVERTGASKKIIWHRLYISSNRFAALRSHSLSQVLFGSKK
jgi:hypothetical protein